MHSHAEFLRIATGEDSLADALMGEGPPVELDAADSAMLAYVQKLTLAPPSVTREDLDGLRALGFDDTAIVQINLIASAFAWLNRAADGLGVGRA